MAKTPKEAENQSKKDTVLNSKKTQIKEIQLPSGMKAKIIKAKGKHVVEAQRLMEGNPDLMLSALISVCTSIDGKKPTIEEVLDFDYMDYLALLGEFQGVFNQARKHNVSGAFF